YVLRRALGRKMVAPRMVCRGCVRHRLFRHARGMELAPRRATSVEGGSDGSAYYQVGNRTLTKQPLSPCENHVNLRRVKFPDHLSFAWKFSSILCAAVSLIADLNADQYPSSAQPC